MAGTTRECFYHQAAVGGKNVQQFSFLAQFIYMTRRLELPSRSDRENR
ncbi:MAG: hypothetical protein M3Z24_07285 [Chloroflexota bacterium]|nr:hypothetical protein [Chloroflexota bacterium]